MGTLWSLQKYPLHLFNAQTRHGIHSPFVFDLFETVFKGKKQPSPPSVIDTIRRDLYRSQRRIEVRDLGAGSESMEGKIRKLSHIASVSGISKKYGRILFRLARSLSPNTILELGTSVGLSTLYLASGNPNARLMTFEGCPHTSAVARTNFKNAGMGHIEIRTGPLDEELPKTISELESIDMALIDANHKEEPTLTYFEQLLPKCHNDTVILLDDIHWSPGMLRAWERIKAYDRVSLTLDLFWMGLVFFRAEQKEKEHLKLWV